MKWVSPQRVGIQRKLRLRLLQAIQALQQVKHTCFTCQTSLTYTVHQSSSQHVVQYEALYLSLI